ncbi:MAG TPA: HAMP domain-containing protein, partial [Candidatus Wallbacteria bacterium]|nr:HAMP domain-containing protein [Candidatus Wallbacteria bacterium]
VYFSIWKDISDPTKKHDELVEVFVQGNQVLIARMTFIAVMICFLSVFVSHKIAGPVYRLEESAKIIASGDFSRRIKLRQGDELQDLADAFNTMTESLDKIIGEDQKMLQNLNLIIEKIKKDFKMKTIAENRKGEIINELQYIADELNKISSAFIVSDNSGPKENIGDDDSEEENA